MSKDDVTTNSGGRHNVWRVLISAHRRGQRATFNENLAVLASHSDMPHKPVARSPIPRAPTLEKRLTSPPVRRPATAPAAKRKPPKRYVVRKPSEGRLMVCGPSLDLLHAHYL